ncbi:MAG: hypothetical protein M1822_010016 [Bathelium mastoideum]|nr:MAG: hypothetical protein M1822_010016 [Bathelium mastoideum]
MSSVRSRNAELQKIIDGLQVELNDLVKMKGEHEDMLLTKFQQILNSKKLKIRDQQRLLAGARVDPAVAAEVQQSRNMLRSRNAESSRSAKRSAETATEESENEEDASDAEARGKTHEENERMDMSPSDRSDEGATEDEEDETEGFTPSSSNLQNRRQGRRRKVSEDKANTEKEESFQGTKEVPPRRELPFARREQHAARTDLGQSNKGSAEHEQENDETTDDEL